MDNQLSQPAISQPTMKKSMPYVFMVCNFGQSFSTVVYMQFQLFFLTNYMGMSLPAISLTLLSTRVCDYIASLMTGPILQKTNTRWGQYRPYAFINPILVTIGNFMVFMNVHGTELFQGFIVALGMLFVGVAMNFQLPVVSGLMSVVAGTSADNRLTITSRNAIAGRVAGFCTSMITAPLLTRIVAGGYNAYLILTISYCLLFVIGSSFVLFSQTGEYDKYDPNKKQVVGSTSSMKVTQMYKEAFSNPQFLVVLLASTLVSCSGQAVSQFNAYYFNYSLENMDLLALAGTISTGVGLLAAFAMPSIARKIGKKRSAVVSSFVQVIANILVMLFSDGNFVLKVVATSLATMGNAVLTAWGVNLYLDTAEYQLYKSGKDTRPFILTFQGMPVKIAMLVAAPVAAFVLPASGFDQATRTMSDTQTLCFWIGLIPVIAFTLAGLLYQFGYKITDEQAREYAEHNKRVMDERQAAAAAGAREET
jgi:Na+/melibiose symporter-like transporter